MDRKCHVILVSIIFIKIIILLLSSCYNNLHVSLLNYSSSKVKFERIQNTIETLLTLIYLNNMPGTTRSRARAHSLTIGRKVDV